MNLHVHRQDGLSEGGPLSTGTRRSVCPACAVPQMPRASTLCLSLSRHGILVMSKSALMEADSLSAADSCHSSPEVRWMCEGLATLFKPWTLWMCSHFNA